MDMGLNLDKYPLGMMGGQQGRMMQGRARSDVQVEPSMRVRFQSFSLATHERSCYLYIMPRCDIVPSRTLRRINTMSHEQAIEH